MKKNNPRPRKNRNGSSSGQAPSNRAKRQSTSTLTLEPPETCVPSSGARADTDASAPTNKSGEWELGFKKPQDFVHARKVFAEAEYSLAGISKLLKGKVPSAPTAAELPELLQLTSGGTPLETLVRLFLFGVGVKEEAAHLALVPTKLEAWVEACVLEIKGGMATPLLTILPFHKLLVAVEGGAPARTRRPDFVMSIGGSTLALTKFTIRGRARRMLDLGTGCGIQALLAAAHCEQVHATDRNPRAIAFARFNAQLNGLSNITFSQGDLFDPVRGREFDLITSNPPLVISPESKYLYRDNGMRRDRFIHKIVREAPEYLRDGGFLQMICNWAHVRNQRWEQRLAEWFAGTGCDAWVIRRNTQTASDYARSWSGSDKSTKELAEHYEQWTAYFQREGIEAISTGMITMRRRRGTNWFRADAWTEELQEETGNDVSQRFEAQDFLEKTRDDAVLLKARLRVSPRVRLEQRCKPSDGAWRCEGARLRRVGGLDYSGPVDPPVASLVLGCDGTRQLQDVLNALSMHGKEVSQSITAQYLDVVRRLVARGILLHRSDDE